MGSTGTRHIAPAHGNPSVSPMPQQTRSVALTQTYPDWPDDVATRTKALSILQSLNAALLSNPSATQTLQQWCAEQGLAALAEIRAVRDTQTIKPAHGAIRAQLQISADEPVGYRRVQLVCGNHVLSDADNWYVPARLTAAMNHTLDTTDVPFGTAVKDLNFSRKTQQARLLWAPLPPLGQMHELPPASTPRNSPHGQRTSTVTPLDIPVHVLQHTATLYRDDDQPISHLVETYTRALFSFSLNNTE